MRPLPWAPGSLFVVIGGVCEGKLEAIGLGQQQADVLVIPAGSRQVLEEEQQLLGEKETVREGPGLQARSSSRHPGEVSQQQEGSIAQCPQLLGSLSLTHSPFHPTQSDSGLCSLSPS